MQGKDILTSRVFWGVVLMLAGWALGYFGVTVPQDEKTIDDILRIVQLVSEIVGAVLAIIGRIKAEKPIKSFLGKTL